MLASSTSTRSKAAQHHDLLPPLGLGLTQTDKHRAEEASDAVHQQPTGELVRRYLPRVRRVVFPMVLDHEAADDISQEVMLKVIRGLDGFRAEASLSTWITRIALNTTYTFLERQKRLSSEPLPDASVDKSWEYSPVHAAIGHELDARIRSSLSELSPKLRAAIVLNVMDGVSPSEAAKIEECPVSTMHWRIHEARKQLRRRLRDYLSEDGGEQ